MPELLEHLVRPCEEYKEEYKECRRWRSRFHQYFIAGQVLDCEGYIQQHHHCQVFKQRGDAEALEALVAIEVPRMRERLHGHASNPVWEHRTEPPAGWTAPLPPMLQERALASSFAAAAAAEGAADPAESRAAGATLDAPKKQEAKTENSSSSPAQASLCNIS